MRRSLSVLSLLCVLSGCSLVVRGSDFLSDGAVDVPDAGRRDGGDVDASREDGGGTGEDGGGTGEDGGGTGEDGGPINRPPLASGVGLSDHRPILGSTLRAFAGPTYDPDGDTLTSRFAWRRNGTLISGASGAALVLDLAAGFAAGDTITVELEVSDGELTAEPVVSGTAVLEDDLSVRWRQLLPPRATARNSLRAFDPTAQRLLFWSRHGTGPGQEFGLWEMQLTPTGTGRWVRTFPTGTPPGASDGTFIHDVARQRVIVFGGRIDAGGGGPDVPSDGVFVLDYATRGAEAWAEVFPSPRPPARSIASHTVSADGTRAWIYGGMDETALLDDLWEIDLEDLSFRRVSESTGDAVLGASLVHDAARNRLIRAGGGPFAGEMPVPDDAIGAWALPGGAYTSEGTLPIGLLGAAAMVEGDTAYLALGADTNAGPSPSVFEIALPTLTVTTTALPEAAPIVLLPIAVSRAPFADGYVLSGTRFDGGSADFYEVRPGAPSVDTITVAGETVPSPLMQATARLEETGGMTIVGGRDLPRGGEAVLDPYVWRLNPEGNWMRAEAGPDPAVGTAPEPRWGLVYDASQEYPWREAWQLLGEGMGGTYPDATPWRLNNSGTAWQQLEMVAGGPQPIGRTGMIAFAGSCRDASGVGNVIGLFGGRGSSGTTIGDTWMLSCTDPGGGGRLVSCNWSDEILNDASPVPPPRSFGAAAVAGHDAGSRTRTVFMFGGRADDGLPLGDVYGLDGCLNPTNRDEWRPVIIEAGPAPEARFGHSMTHMRTREGLPSEAPSAILMAFGGTQDNGYSVLKDLWRFVPTGRPGLGYEARWEALTPAAGPAPAGRMYHVAVYDPVQERLVVYGGYAEDRTLDDLWELRLRALPIP